jgi:tRNA-specific 2-thiouridylase
VPDGTIEVTAQLRAHGHAWPAVARLADQVLHVRFADPADSVAPGQAVVLYDGTRVVGSATVDTTVPAAAP